MSLADDVIQGSGQVTTQAGQTVGNAMEAYQLAQKTQAMRQELEQKKQENEMNKSHWLLGQIDTIGRMPEGAARDLAIESFGKQAPSVFPNFNPDIPTLFKKDPELVMKANTAAQAYINGQPFDPTALNSFASSQTPDALKMIHSAAENVEKIKAAQLAATSGRVSAMQDNAVMGATKGIHATAEPFIKKLQAFDTDLNQLSANPNWQTFNEAFQNYANTLSGSRGVISDNKLKDMKAELLGEKAGRWGAYLASNPGAASNAADPEAVKWLIGKISEVGKINERQMGAAVNRRKNIDSQFLHNKSLVPAMAQAAAPYSDGTWRQQDPNYTGPGKDYGVSQTAPASPAAPEGGDTGPGGALDYNSWKKAGMPKAPVSQ